MKTKRKQIGFTLIELMIVVAIIAIIASVAIPSVFSARRSSNASSAIANLKSFATAMGNYAQDLDDQTYPADPDSFGDYYSHIDVKNGYRYFYITEKNGGPAPSKMVYVALPVNETAGIKCYYTDESHRIWQGELDWDDRAASIKADEDLMPDWETSTQNVDGQEYGSRLIVDGITGLWNPIGD